MWLLRGMLGRVWPCAYLPLGSRVRGECAFARGVAVPFQSSGSDVFQLRPLRWLGGGPPPG